MDYKKFVKKNWVFIIGFVVLALLIISNNPKEVEPVDLNNTIEWQISYESQASEFIDYDTFVVNTDYYDYNNIMISQVASEIAFRSSDAREAVGKALDYVYSNVDYVYGESDNNCFTGTAPSILESGTGQCDTQSITLVSILRRMGLAAQPVGGCILIDPDCYLKLSMFGILREFGYAPRFTILETVDKTQETFSRGFSRKGGLHAWVNVWLPSEGWVTLESTTGDFADTSCYFYHVELFPANNDKNAICVSDSYDYANACYYNDLSSLDENGLGLSNEVNP